MQSNLRQTAVNLLANKEIPVQAISDWTWHEKYRHKKPDGSSTEHSIADSHERVVRGVYARDPKADTEAPKALALMMDMVWCPAGRIHAGAGTENRVTLINCYVSPDIQDSMDTIPGSPKTSKGIMDALKVGALTQQMGGGIGMDFSTLRPEGAVVKRTNSVATGPLYFMDMWDAMCVTVKSSGSRRGAMMGVMHINHPDVVKFITAKHQKGKLENFNVSVLVSDDFMTCLKEDGVWEFYFDVPRADGKHVREFVAKDPYGVEKTYYVYNTMPARELWDLILKSTYEYAEPGVIFIDRVNKTNNLWYCEHIHATNPCGEQPLPPDGDCNLGAINLARLVLDPFGKHPEFNWKRLGEAVAVGVRFLDNVLDVSLYPTKNQEEEAHLKRRTGLGITGLGNCLQMLKLRYGSQESLDFVAALMRYIRDAAYTASIELARERGAFPAFDKDKYLKGEFIKRLPQSIRNGIAKHGIRNGVILTIAPTGTTSMYYGNVSSGLEPTFAWKYRRKVREADGSYREFGDVYDYGFLLFKEVTEWNEGDDLPDYMVSALELPVEDHLKMQAVCQTFIDASISKTINCPVDMTFEDFGDVYLKAYDWGCKGCTTYRPSGVRGAVLSVDGQDQTRPVVTSPVVPDRPEELEGTTYKVRYPGIEQAFYVTMNDAIIDGKRVPFEIFINSKSVQHQEFIVAMTRMLSAIFRRGGDVTFILEELRQVHSAKGGVFLKGQYLPSFVAFLGNVIERHFEKIGLIQHPTAEAVVDPATSSSAIEQVIGDICPSCEAPTLVRQEGCNKCTSCGHSDCG